MISKTSFTLGALALASLALFGCPKGDQGTTGNGGGGTGGGTSGEKVYIAVAGPMSGDAAAFGDQIKKAATLKVKEVNDAGGINGKMIELVVEDDKAETAEATTVARRLAARTDVSIVIGHFNSTCSNAAKGEYNRKGVVSFSPGSTNVSVCKGSPWTFRNLYRDDYQGQFLAHYALKKLGAKKAAVFYDNDDYGKGLMKAFTNEAKKIGLEIVANESYIRGRTQDFKPVVQKIVSKEPDAIFVAGLYNDGALIAKAAKTDLNMKAAFLGGDGLLEPKFIEIAGKAAEGAFVTTPFLFNTGNDSEAAKAFLAAHKAAYDKEPSTWGALTYDAVGMAIEAIKAVGTDRAKIKEWFASRTSKETGYNGVTGNTYFDAEGDCYSKPAYVAQVKAGQFNPAPKQMTAEELEAK